MVLGITIAAEVAGKLVMNAGLASQLRPRRYYTVPRETLDSLLGDVHELVNFLVIESQRILFAENIAASTTVSRISSGLYMFWKSPTNSKCNIGRHQRLPLVLAR